MNKTIVNDNDLLEELNDETAVVMVPAFVYMVILMLVGLGGNILVLFYYGWKSRPSTNNTFILCIAMYDVILCTFSIPMEIVDIRFFYNFPYSSVCKIMRFINYFTAVGSAFILIVISVDRFKKICRPFKRQFKQTHVRIACGISIPFSLVFSCPAAVFNTSVPVEVSTNDGITLTGLDCTTTKDPSYKMYLLVFNSFRFLSFIISTVVILTMYALVGRAIFKHHKSHVQHTGLISSVESHVLSSINCSKQESGNTEHNSEKDKNHSATSSIDRTYIVPNKTNNHVSVKTIKFTVLMFVITLVFIISFLPHLVLSVWRNFQSTYEGETLDGPDLVAFQIGLRSYFMNSAINPIIYGFFNSKFRGFFYKRLCPCYKHMTDTHTISTSS